MISSYDDAGSSPVPRWMARLMLSAGMLTALASAMIVRRRGFMSGSPPPLRAATVISLMMRVKILPRLASSGALLVLDGVPLGMAGHAETPEKQGIEDPTFYTLTSNSQLPTPKRPLLEARFGPRFMVSDLSRARTTTEDEDRRLGSLDAFGRIGVSERIPA